MVDPFESHSLHHDTTPKDVFGGFRSTTIDKSVISPNAKYADGTVKYRRESFVVVKGSPHALVTWYTMLARSLEHRIYAC